MVRPGRAAIDALEEVGLASRIQFAVLPYDPHTACRRWKVVARGHQRSVGEFDNRQQGVVVQPATERRGYLYANRQIPGAGGRELLRRDAPRSVVDAEPRAIQGVQGRRLIVLDLVYSQSGKSIVSHVLNQPSEVRTDGRVCRSQDRVLLEDRLLVGRNDDVGVHHRPLLPPCALSGPTTVHVEGTTFRFHFTQPVVDVHALPADPREAGNRLAAELVDRDHLGLVVKLTTIGKGDPLAEKAFRFVLVDDGVRPVLALIVRDVPEIVIVGIRRHLVLADRHGTNQPSVAQTPYVRKIERTPARVAQRSRHHDTRGPEANLHPDIRSILGM